MKLSIAVSAVKSVFICTIQVTPLMLFAEVQALREEIEAKNIELQSFATQVETRNGELQELSTVVQQKDALLA